MPAAIETSEAVAVDVWCSRDALSVALEDGRTISVPLAWFPRLLAATPRQRRHWEPIDGGVGIHWEEIDEVVSATRLLQPEWSTRLAESVLESRARAPRRPRARSLFAHGA